MPPGILKKKSTQSASIFRYVVSRASIIDVGFGYSSWKKADVLHLVEDNLGVAKYLEQLFSAVGVRTKIVRELPEEAGYVIYLRGMNRFDTEQKEQYLAINEEAFKIASTCGKKLFAGNGCLVLPFDNGLSNEGSNERAWSSGISALAKTAQLEWPNADVQGLNIHCSGKSPEKVAEEIFKMMTSGGMVTEVEIDNDGKGFQLISTAAEIQDLTRPLNDGDTIIVSGGAKGVTAACLIALSERRKINIGILGRTAMEEEPSYLSAYRTDAELKAAIFQQVTKEGRKISPIELNKTVTRILSNREIVENVDALKANGSVVRYFSVDISNKQEVITAVESLRSEFGSIQGIVHAAGVLADKYIHEKTIDQFQTVFKTKVTGFINMLDASAGDNLTHICCFSSVAARMGNAGQVDYAMANEVLNKVCCAEQRRRGDTCVVKSMNWGPWDGGMVSPELKKHFETMGVDLIPLQTGAEMFADEMEDASRDNVEIVIGGAFDGWGIKSGIGLKNIHTMWVHQSNSPYLDSHRIQGKVIVPMMMANEWCMRLAKSVCPKLGIAEVSNLKVYKGIQLNNFDKGGDLLSFVYTLERSSADAVVTIRIEDEKGHQMYTVAVKLSGVTGVSSVTTFDLNDLQTWNWKRKDIYNGRLFHGPDFQVIDKLRGISEDGCKGSLKISRPELITNEEWMSDMFLFDGGIQLAVLAMDKWTGNNSSLPLGYDSLKLYGQSGTNNQMNCELIVKKKGDMDSEWDIHFRNADQELVAEMKGLRIYMHKISQN